MTVSGIEGCGSYDTARREERARSLAAMGLVNRVRDRFLVSTPSLSRKDLSHVVRRDENGNICCNCREYLEMIGDSAAFRCEHILAVKFALIQKTTEPSTKGKPAQGSRSQMSPGRSAGRNMKEVLVTSSQSRHTDAVRHRDAFENRGNLKDGMRGHKTEGIHFVQGAGEGTPENRNNVVQINSADTNPELTGKFRNFRDCMVSELDDIQWHTVADILDEKAPSWSHTVRDIRQIGDKVAVTVAITIGGTTREGLGTGDAECEESIMRAEHKALKGAAVKFDVIREIDNVEFGMIVGRPRVPTGPKDLGTFPDNPLAVSLFDLVTGRQLWIIRGISKELGLDPDQECQRVMNCKSDELSKNAASVFIGHLSELNRQVELSILQPLKKVG